MTKYHLQLLLLLLSFSLFADPVLDAELFRVSGRATAQDIVFLILDGASLNAPQTAGMTSFQRAILENHLDVVRMMHEMHGDLEHRDTFAGDSGIHFAVMSADAAVLDYVLAHAENVNARNNAGENALHVALRMQRADMYLPLLNAGVELFEPNNAGITPWMMARRLDLETRHTFLTFPRVRQSIDRVIYFLPQFLEMIVSNLYVVAQPIYLVVRTAASLTENIVHRIICRKKNLASPRSSIGCGVEARRGWRYRR